MKKWCMSFSTEENDNLFPYCKDKNIAAMQSYYWDGSSEKKPVFDNLRDVRFSKFKMMKKSIIDNNKDYVKRKQIDSIENLRYHVKKDDIIYVREGMKKIISKGIVTSKGYYWDNSKFHDCEVEGINWPHMVDVEWATNFESYKIEFNPYIRGMILFELDELSEKTYYSNPARKIINDNI